MWPGGGRCKFWPSIMPVLMPRRWPWPGSERRFCCGFASEAGGCAPGFDSDRVRTFWLGGSSSRRSTSSLNCFCTAFWRWAFSTSSRDGIRRMFWALGDEGAELWLLPQAANLASSRVVRPSPFGIERDTRWPGVLRSCARRRCCPPELACCEAMRRA